MNTTPDFSTFFLSSPDDGPLLFHRDLTVSCACFSRTPSLFRICSLTLFEQAGLSVSRRPASTHEGHHTDQFGVLVRQNIANSSKKNFLRESVVFKSMCLWGHIHLGDEEPLLAQSFSTISLSTIGKSSPWELWRRAFVIRFRQDPPLRSTPW